MSTDTQALDIHGNGDAKAEFKRFNPAAALQKGPSLAEAG